MPRERHRFKLSRTALQLVVAPDFSSTFFPARSSALATGELNCSSALETHSIATVCTKCGVTIQDATAERNAGLCQPCSEGRTARKHGANRVAIPRGRSLDWQCIGIEKKTETAEDATYLFVADIWEPDPENRGRSRIVGQAEGILRIIKATGEVLLDQPMPEDTNDRRFNSAAHKIKKHWKQNEYPEKTMFACG